MLAALKRENPKFDELCEKYAEAILSDDPDGCHSCPDEDDEDWLDELKSNEQPNNDTKEADFAALLGETEHDHRFHKQMSDRMDLLAKGRIS